MAKKPEKKPKTVVVDSPLPKTKTPAPKKATAISSAEELKNAGISDELIQGNIPIVRKFERGVYSLEFTIATLKGEQDAKLK